MGSNSNRSRKLAVLRPILSLLPRCSSVVIVTFHDIRIEHFPWFEQFLAMIHANFEFADPKTDLCAENVGSNDPIKVLISFDDGFKSNRIVAEKFLARYNAKALFFLTEDFIGLGDDAAFDFAKSRFFLKWVEGKLDRGQCAAMSWADVSWLVQAGHSIGAHSRTHVKLAGVDDPNQLKDEVVLSADRLETRLQRKIDSFAFPFGSVESISIQALELAKSRFDYIFSNVRGAKNKSPDNSFIYRQNIVPGDPMWLAKAFIEGKVDWRYKSNQTRAKQLAAAAGQ